MSNHNYDNRPGKQSEQTIRLLDHELGVAVKQMVHWRGMYEGQKATNKALSLWLEGYHRLYSEAQLNDLDRLLEIMSEIEEEDLTRKQKPPLTDSY